MTTAFADEVRHRGGVAVIDLAGRIWQHTLRALATHFASAAAVSTTVVCVDEKRQWNRVGDVEHDAVFDTLTKPFRRAH